MKELKIIQTLAKIGKVLSKIVYICGIVSLCMCIVGIISVATGFGVIKLGGITLKSIISDNFGFETGTLYAYLSAGIVFCTGEMILAKNAENYFKRELNDGTPFTFEGAKELFRLGILNICIPIGTQILAKIVYSVVSKFTNNEVAFGANDDTSVMLGIMLMVIAVICKYGATLRSKETE